MIRYPRINLVNENEILNVDKSRIVIPDSKSYMSLCPVGAGKFAGLGYCLNKLYDYIVTEDEYGEKILLKLERGEE